MNSLKQYVSYTLIATTLFLTACATGAKVNSELLSAVQTTAVVSVKFDRRGQGAGTNSITGSLTEMGKWAGKYPDPTEGEATFYNTFNGRAMKILDENAPFTIQSRKTTVSNASYKALKEDAKNRYFIPAPYSEIGDITPEKAISLCKALNVDAVLAIKYEFREKKSTAFMATEVSRSLRGTFEIINKDGEVVLEGASQSEFFEIESGVTIGGFGVNSEEREVYNEMADSFLQNFKEDLIAAESM